MLVGLLSIVSCGKGHSRAQEHQPSGNRVEIQEKGDAEEEKSVEEKSVVGDAQAAVPVPKENRNLDRHGLGSLQNALQDFDLKSESLRSQLLEGDFREDIRSIGTLVAREDIHSVEFSPEEWPISENLLPDVNRRRGVSDWLEHEADGGLDKVVVGVLEHYKQFGGFESMKSFDQYMAWKVVSAMSEVDNADVRRVLGYSIIYLRPEVLFGGLYSRICLSRRPGLREYGLWIMMELELQKNPALIPMYEYAITSRKPQVVAKAIAELCGVRQHVSSESRRKILAICRDNERPKLVRAAARAFLFPKDVGEGPGGERLKRPRIGPHEER